MRVVIDTNIFIAAFFEDNLECSLVLKREHNGEFQLIMSNKMQEELLRVLNISINEYELTLKETMSTFKVLSRALLRAELTTPKINFNNCEDKDDNMFFECAIDGNADYIISKDKHVHALKNLNIKNKNKQKIEILYPDEFLSKLDKKKLAIHFNSK